jgi:SAM-dependent methyltransferase
VREPGGHFDRVATEYDDTIAPHVTRHYLEKRVAFARRVWPRGSRLLDLGCGTGRLADALAGAGFRMTGVDRSPGMLRQARARGLDVACASAETLPWLDGAFDGAISVAVMHHLESAARVAGAVREMVRVTRAGGGIVVWDHNPLNPYWPVFMRRLPQDDGRERLIGRRELRRCAARSGARVVSEAGLGWVPDFVPERLLGAGRALERILEGVPGVRRLAAHNVIVLRKERVS